ncbi:MAG: nitroreductase family protein [Proteobacteria bacterium]|nr:nitroreductase family protein [Pseudomonadota bacterium]MBU1061089.1 nitroreductase family protein [Pseudomonadota bacterium]
MFIDLLRKRRSIRQFQEKEVEQEKLELLIEAMLRAPSSRSLNPWEFVVVTEKETIKALARSKPHGAAFVKNAPLVIVVCADPEKCDVWIEDCSIASILLHLAATDLGLGSCWVQVRLRGHDGQQSAEAYVAGVLGLKEGLAVEAMIAIGYPGEEKKGHPPSSLLVDRVSYRKG